MKKIIATFNIDKHNKEYQHFVALFGSKYAYHYSKFNGETIVDITEF